MVAVREKFRNLRANRGSKIVTKRVIDWESMELASEKIMKGYESKGMLVGKLQAE